MKFATTAILGLLLAEQAAAFAPFTPVSQKYHTGSSSGRFMAMGVDMPPAAQSTEVPVIQKSSYGPTDVRYSDFLRLVNADKIEKVTFSADGTQLLGVDVDGTRVKIEALPNDPELLTQLTDHKVRFEMHQVNQCSTNLSLTPFVVRLMLLFCLPKKRAALENWHKVLSSPLLSSLAFSS